MWLPVDGISVQFDGLWLVTRPVYMGSHVHQHLFDPVQ